MLQSKGDEKDMVMALTPVIKVLMIFSQFVIAKFIIRVHKLQKHIHYHSGQLYFSENAGSNRVYLIYFVFQLFPVGCLNSSTMNRL